MNGSINTNDSDNLDDSDDPVNCDTDHLRAFLVYSITTFLSGVGWFTRMTVDTAIDFVSVNL